MLYGKQRVEQSSALQLESGLRDQCWPRAGCQQLLASIVGSLTALKLAERSVLCAAVHILWDQATLAGSDLAFVCWLCCWLLSHACSYIVRVARLLSCVVARTEAVLSCMQAVHAGCVSAPARSSNNVVRRVQR
jgi:hypothetical protein